MERISEKWAVGRIGQMYPAKCCFIAKRTFIPLYKVTKALGFLVITYPYTLKALRQVIPAFKKYVFNFMVMNSSYFGLCLNVCRYAIMTPSVNPLEWNILNLEQKVNTIAKFCKNQKNLPDISASNRFNGLLRYIKGFITLNDCGL